MSTRLAGLLIGACFGLVLSWSGMTSPDVIREALLFQNAYLFLFFASAVLTASAGLWILRRMRVRSLLTGERIDWPPTPLRRRHITGSLLFGLGWGVADACPGPIATQLGQGIWWGLWTLAGVTVGVLLFLRRGEPDSEPARERAAPPITA
ncbi:MAG TPA: DUF6691 family protein [Solirubrobacteraceae bacterium]|nr:DUF6691 family protein [Solirubrobacteraceae bacterium]